MSKKNSNVLNLKSTIIKDKKIFKIYKDFKSEISKITNNKPFVAAISGGADSLALAALSEFYRIEKKIIIHFVLIDHGIRKNSQKEARSVQKLLKKFFIFLIIKKNKNKFKANIQKAARDMRYKFLSDFCKKKKIKYILTAHHMDDQIETFLIRLSRGSGIQGLSSMNRVSILNNNIRIVRPFLNVKKKDLKYTSKKIFKKVFEDPSNKNKKYLRTRIRTLKNKFERSGISHSQIIRSINNLATSRDIVNNYLSQAIKQLTEKRRNEILIKLKPLLLENEEIQFKVLSQSIQNFSKSYYPPRSKKIFNILNKLKERKKLKSTLAGCVIEKTGSNLSITRE